MKKLLTLAIVLVLASCQNEELDQDTIQTETNQQEILSISEINAFIQKQLDTTGDVDWTTNPLVLYSAAHHGGNIVTVGYGNSDSDISIVGSKRSNAQITAKKQILTTVQQMEASKRITR